MVQPVRQSAEAQTERTVTQAFEDMDDSLLILGNAGAGKTSMLLELAEILHAKAVTNDSAPIPVLLELARWVRQSTVLPPREVTPGERRRAADAGQSTRAGPSQRVTISRREARRFGIETGQAHSFREWVISELNYLYSIPRAVGESWLRNRKLTLLMDGLDEVPPGLRDQCVEAINKFQNDYNVPAMAITSRQGDYDRLNARLTLQGTVQINPLTRLQISEFLDSAGDRLRGVREALRGDDTLWQLLDSPLMLNVMVLAYHDRPAREVALGDTIADRRKRLIAAYVEEVITRRQAPAASYELYQIQRWLAQLAYCAQMHQPFMPLYRSLTGWRMPWYSTAPESRVRFTFSSFFPWTAGISCSLGAVLPLSLRLGTLVALIPAMLVLIVQTSYMVITTPIQRGKVDRSVVYARLRRNGVVAGTMLGAAEFLVLAMLYNHVSAIASAVRVLIVIAPMMLFLALGARLENLVSGVFIEIMWSAALTTGFLSGYVLYRWHPSSRYLTFAFAVGFIATIGLAVLALAAFFAINRGVYFRFMMRRPDWLSIVAPVTLTAITVIATLASREHHLSPSLAASAGVVAGEIWALALAFPTILLVRVLFPPLKIVLAGLDLFPFRLNKFLEYAVDRSLLYREKRGYAFIHAIFQDYFHDRYRELERQWAATAYKDFLIPDALPPIETLDDI
jgi:hypothetical protein